MFVCPHCQKPGSTKVTPPGFLPPFSHTPKILRPADRGEQQVYDGERIPVLLPHGIIPGVEAFLINGFVKSAAHVHAVFSEIYIVLQGSLVVATWDPTHTPFEFVQNILEAGDVFTIPVGTGHKVLSGSSENVVQTLYTPRYLADDVTLFPEVDRILERES